MLGIVRVGDSYQIGETDVAIPENLGGVSFNFITADPIHYGHMQMARTVLSEHADTVLLPLHNYYPPQNGAEYRAKYPAPYEHRLEMVRLGTREMGKINPEMRGCLDVLTPSDFNQTPEQLFECLKQLAEKYAERMFFVIGSSSLVTNRFQQLTRDLAPWGSLSLLINERDGYAVPETRELEEYGFSPKLCVLEDLGTSSSEIRKRSRNGESIEGLTPPSIIEYIKENDLYSKH